MRARVVVYALFIVSLVAFTFPWSVASAVISDQSQAFQAEDENGPPPWQPHHKHRHRHHRGGVGTMSVQVRLIGPGANLARISMGGPNTLNGAGETTWIVNTSPKDEKGLKGSYGIGLEGRYGGPVPYFASCTLCTDGSCQNLTTASPEPGYVRGLILLNRPERGAQFMCTVAGR